MLEAIIRALGDKLDERTHAKFAELGVPLKGKLQSAYSRELWWKVAHYAGEVLNPGLPPEQQRWELGRRFVFAYNETIVGKALMSAMRVLGPKRALARAARNFRTGNNYSTAEMKETPEGIEMHVTGQTWPEWYGGLFEAAVEMCGGKNVKVTLLSADPPRLVVYRVAFS